MTVGGSVRTRLYGLAALLGLVVAVVGIPVALLGVAGSPIPSAMPGWDGVADALTRPDDGTLFLRLLLVVAWAAWGFFALCVAVEVVAQLRGVPAPRLPGLRLQQNAARGLVGAVALLFAAMPITANAAPAVAAGAASTVSVAYVSTSSPPVAAPQPLAAAVPVAAAPAPVVGPTHEVEAGETLWSIAEQQLGDGRRFPDIAELNYGVPQPDGRTLTSTHWIHPGWLLTMPPPPLAGGTAVDSPYTVQSGDTLSEISVEQLGDPTRYAEIFEASVGIDQPGGQHLVDPDIIGAGWTLRIPPIATDAPPVDVTPPAQEAPVAPGPAAITEPPPASSNGGGVVEELAPDGQMAVPEESTAPNGNGGVDQTIDTAGQEGADVDEAFPVRTTAGIGAILAAGLLGLVATRRGVQQRRRGPGQSVPLPDGAAAGVEQDLRSTADPLSATAVDLALRNLAADCANRGVALPVVRAARLTADQFDLYLAEPATDLPAPWAGTADATVWSLPVEATTQLDPDAGEMGAPYPSLVTIGHDDEDGHVLLDLEYLGALGVTGPPSATREVLAAIAVELATSQWADDLQVTIVGAYPELEDTLQTGRIRYVPAVGRLLDELTERAAQDRELLAENGAGDLNAARATATAPGIWTPEILLLAGDMTDRQRTQLRQLLQQLPRVAIAAVTSGEPVGEWALKLDGDRAVLEPIGLQVLPQRIDESTYASLLDMVAIASEPPVNAQLAATAEPALADLPTPPARHARLDPDYDIGTIPAAEPVSALALEDGTETPVVDGTQNDKQETTDIAAEPLPPTQGSQLEAPGIREPAEPTKVVVGAPTGTRDVMPLRGAPQILLLGPIKISNTTGPIEPSKQASLTELLAFLALNPGRDHSAIDAAIWPGKPVTSNTRNTAMSKLRRWLGVSTEGVDYLPRYQADTGYRLTADVHTDWQVWQQLLPNGAGTAATDALEQALTLVRGRPFDGTRARRYAWAENVRQQMISEIVDASYELARRRLMDGRWRAAEQAVVVGLGVEPGMERLWRIRILAAHSSGNPAAEQEAIDRLTAITDDLGGDLEEETEELLAQLKNPNTPGRTLAAQGL